MKTQDMSGDDGGKSDRQENDVCFDQASDEDGEIEKGSDFVEESSQNECEEKKEKRQTQTPVKKTVWVLVFDVEENKHSPPILLEDVQDKSGRNGVKANLKKHDKVLYEGKLREAFIVSQSDNKENLDEKYNEMMELMKLILQEQSNGKFWHYTEVILWVVMAGGIAVAAAPLLSSAAGFTAGGIGAGSAAAQLMSWSAIANGGGIGAGSAAQLMSWSSAIANGGGIGAGSIAQLLSSSAIANGGGVAAGGMYSALQSAGMAGISTSTNLLIGSAAGTAGSALAHTLSEKPGSPEGSEHQCFICLDGCAMYTALKPCGHQFTCESCAEKLQKCPICKTPIQN